MWKEYYLIRIRSVHPYIHMICSPMTFMPGGGNVLRDADQDVSRWRAATTAPVMSSLGSREQAEGEGRRGMGFVCNTPGHLRVGRVTLSISLGSLDWPHRTTLVFSTHFVLHSCAPGKDFPVGYPSSNCSGPSTLNLGVFCERAFEKKVATCWYAYPINPIEPWARISHCIDFDRSVDHHMIFLKSEWFL